MAKMPDMDIHVHIHFHGDAMIEEPLEEETDEWDNSDSDSELDEPEDSEVEQD